MCKYVKIHASIFANISIYIYIYICTSKRTYTNMLTLNNSQTSEHVHTNNPTFHTKINNINNLKKYLFSWVCSKRKKREVWAFYCSFLCICALIASVNPSEITTQPSGPVTHHLTLANPASWSTCPCPSLSSPLYLTVASPRLLKTAFLC